MSAGIPGIQEDVLLVAVGSDLSEDLDVVDGSPGNAPVPQCHVDQHLLSTGGDDVWDGEGGVACLLQGGRPYQRLLNGGPLVVATGWPG